MENLALSMFLKTLDAEIVISYLSREDLRRSTNYELHEAVDITGPATLEEKVQGWLLQSLYFHSQALHISRTDVQDKIPPRSVSLLLGPLAWPCSRSVRQLYSFSTTEPVSFAI